MNSFKKILLQNHKYAPCLFVFFIVAVITVSCGGPAEKKQSDFRIAFAKIDAASKTAHRTFTRAELQFFDSMLYSAKKTTLDDILDLNGRKTSFYIFKKLYDSAIIYQDSNMLLLQKHLQNEKYADQYIKAFFIKGDINADKQNYDEVVRNYTSAKIFMSSYKTDTALLYRYYHSMAHILFAQRKYLLAVDFFRMICDIAPVVFKNSYDVYGSTAENTNNIGECYYHAGRTDSALYYYNAALDYISKSEKKLPPGDSSWLAVHRAVVYGDKAAILQQQKDFEGAEKLYLESYNCFQKVDDRSFNNYLLTSIASLYLETGQLKKAADMLSAFASANDTSEIKKITGSYYKLLSDFYLQTKEMQASNNALQHAGYIDDSLERRDRNFIGTDISKEFERQEQKRMYETLKRDLKIKKNYLLAAIISAVLAFLIVLLAWNHLNRKSRFAKKLTTLNTELERKNDDLLKTMSSLEQSHLENKSIVRVVAHDLKSPVSGIRTLAYSLLKKEPDEEKKDALQLIQSTCTDAVSLINDLLDSKRSLAAISKELVDMGRLIEQCAALFQVKAGEKNQRITLQVDHPVMMLNRHNIMRVISNIVNNAIKFSPANAEIRIQLQRKEESVLLSVHDTSIDIPNGLKEEIVTREPLSGAGDAEEKLYGPGLSLSKKIIEEHAGHLWLASEAGKGSVFYVELPYHINA